MVHPFLKGCIMLNTVLQESEPNRDVANTDF